LLLGESCLELLFRLVVFLKLLHTKDFSIWLERCSVDKTKELEGLCLSIFAHSHTDYEVTLSGNGTNCSEASNVALAVLDILHGDGRKWRRANEKQIEKQAKKLRKEYGDE
jgi:hypothetical protein